MSPKFFLRSPYNNITFRAVLICDYREMDSYLCLIDKSGLYRKSPLFFDDMDLYNNKLIIEGVDKI
jgi:hypothetical protein